MSPIEIPEHLSFTDKGEPASEEQIAAAEDELGRKIPAPYREFLTRHNGCRVDPPNFKMPDGSTSEHGSVSWFLGVGVQDSLDLVAIAEMYEGRLPDGTLAIARDPGGNLLLLDGGGSVLFWHHEFEDEDDEDEEDDEAPADEAVQPVAGDFERFLASLEE